MPLNLKLLKQAQADLKWVLSALESTDLQVRVNLISSLRSVESFILNGENYETLKAELERIGDAAIVEMEAQEAEIAAFDLSKLLGGKK